MIEKTVKEYDDEDFQKWWARHPWRKVKVIDSYDTRPFYHINLLNWFSALTVAVGVSVAVCFFDLVKCQQYAYDKNELTEKQMQQKYNHRQIARYEKFVELRQRLK